jgi:hypothetical protein
MAEEMRSGELNPASFIEVEDSARSHLFTVQFREVYRVKVS